MTPKTGIATGMFRDHSTNPAMLKGCIEVTLTKTNITTGKFGSDAQKPALPVWGLHSPNPALPKECVGLQTPNPALPQECVGFTLTRPSIATGMCEVYTYQTQHCHRDVWGLHSPNPALLQGCVGVTLTKTSTLQGCVRLILVCIAAEMCGLGNDT